MPWIRTLPNAMMWRPKSGNWIGPHYGQFTQQNTVSQGTMFCVPLFLPACELDKISCHVRSGVANAVIRLGLYLDNGEGAPGALLAEASETVDASTSGDKDVAISAVVTEGLYWGALKADTAGTAIPFSSVLDHFGLVPISADTSTKFRQGSFGNGRSSYLRPGLTSGALPDPFGSAVVAHAGPLISLRVK